MARICDGCGQDNVELYQVNVESRTWGVEWDWCWNCMRDRLEPGPVWDEIIDTKSAEEAT